MTHPRSVTHATFDIERTYDASPARLWKALTDPAAKAQWFGVPSERVEILERALEVRPGGRERLKGRFGAGVVSLYDATYYDVVEHERLVYCYEMHMDDRKISVSVATLQLKAQGSKTRLLLTEQGAYLDGYDDAAARKHGTVELLAALGSALRPS
jgi:uncharacterized protein YndB with AHSA1/START domain